MFAPNVRSRLKRAIFAWPPWMHYGAALLLVAATTALIALVNSDWGFLDRITIMNPGTVYIIAVALTVVLFGIGPALLAVGASALGLALFFAEYENGERVIVLVITMVIIVYLGHRQRRAQIAAEGAQAKAEALLDQVERERRFTQDILENVPVGIAVVRSDDFTVLSFNGEYDASVQRAPGSERLAVGKSLVDTLAPDARSPATRLLSHTRDTGVPERTTAYASAVVPDQFYDGSIQPLRFGDGTDALLITSVNVTERVHGERERETLLAQVEQQAAQLEATFESMLDGIAVYDAEGNVLHRNEAFYRLLRLEPGAAPPLWEAFIRDMNLRHAVGTPMTREQTHSYRALRGETIRDTVVLVRDGWGRDRFLSQNASPIRAADGRAIGAVVVFNDVTERLERERERERLLQLVEERRQFAQAIFDTVPVGLAVIDTETLTFSTANPAFRADVREPYRNRSLNDVPLAGIFPDIDDTDAIARLRAIATTGEPFTRRAARYMHLARGETYFDEMVVPLPGASGRGRYVLYQTFDVTEQVWGQQRITMLAQAASERASQLEAIFGALTEGVILADVHDTIIRSNAALARILGLDAGEPLPPLNHFGVPFAMRDADDDAIPQELRVAKAAMRGTTQTGRVRRFRTARGEERWMSVSASPVRDAAGIIVGVAMTMRDVTEERRASEERERLLREMEDQRRFARTIIESAPAGIIVFGAAPAFTVRLVNDQALPLLDPAWRGRGITGEPLHAFIPNAEESGILPIFRRVAETGEPVHLREFELVGFERGTTYFDWSLVPLHETGDGVTGLLLLITEVTDRVLSRQRIEELADAAALRAAELEAVIANMPDGVSIHGPDGRIIQMNATGRRISGEEISPEQSLPTVVEHFDLHYPDGRVIPLDDLPLPRALRGEITSGYEFISHTRNGARNILTSSAPIRSLAGEITSAVVVFSDVTERRRAEGLTTRLGRILDASLNEIYVFDADSLRFVQANAGARRNLGYSMEELLAFTPLDLKPALTQKSFDALLAPLRAGEEDEITYEGVHQRKDGSRYPVDVHLQLSRSETPPVFVAIVQDITERHVAEEQRERLLREIDERRRLVQTVIESAPVGIAAFATDPEMSVRVVNDPYLRLLGVPPRDAGLAGVGMRSFIAGAEADLLLAHNRRVIETGEPISLREFAYHGLARGPSYFDWSLVPLHEADDRVTGVLSLVSDVTERVESRRRIEELALTAAQRTREMEIVIASIVDGVMVTNAAGVMVLENDASRQLTGRVGSVVHLSLDQHVGVYGARNPDGEMMRTEDLPLARAVRGETVTEQVLLLRRVDTGDDRFLLCSSAPVRAANGTITGAVAVFRDITQMKQLEQMKDEFVSIAAHELRTPLTAIKGYAELLDRRLSAQTGRESDRKSLGVIRKQTERLAGLVNEMLDVSRIEAGRLQLNVEPFNLSTVVGEVVNNLRVSSDQHTLALDAEPDVAVNGDIVRIEQVLMNLISNAITYSPQGGEIGVCVWREGNAALVAVNDRGVGVAPEELTHLFDRFYRAPRAGVMRSGGMGLGLYICREIVTRHGGTIRAESVEGVGSTFIFTLPLSGEVLSAEC